MSQHHPITMYADLHLDMVAAEDIVRRALGAEGFGVLTEIDVQQTLHDKLDVAVPPYRILGACNPALAHRAITAMPEVGTLLPCNVVLRAIEPGTTRVDIADPLPMLALLDDAELHGIATDAHERLARVAEALRRTPPAADVSPPSSLSSSA